MGGCTSEICGVVGLVGVESSIDGARGLDMGWLVALNSLWIRKYEAKFDEVVKFDDEVSGRKDIELKDVEWNVSFAKHDLLNILSKAGSSSYIT